MSANDKTFLFSLTVLLSLSITVTVSGGLLSLVLFVAQLLVVLWQIIQSAKREQAAYEADQEAVG